MISVVTALPPIQFDVIVFEFQGRIHLLVRQRPIAMLIVQIVVSVLKVNSNRLHVGFSNEARVSVSVADVGEATDMADNFSKFVWSLPSNGERADSATTGSTDRTAARIIGDVVLLFDFRQNFIEQKFRVIITERIVFDASVFGFRLPTGFLGQGFLFVTRINKHAYRDGKLIAVNQVVKNYWSAVIAILADVSVTVLKNHQGRGFGFVILLRHVNVVTAFGPREHFALKPSMFDDLPLRHAFLAL